MCLLYQKQSFGQYHGVFDEITVAP